LFVLPNIENELPFRLWQGGAMLSILLAATLSAAPAKLKWEPKIDIPVTAGLAGAWLVTEFALKKSFAPKTCQWCDTNGFDEGIRKAFNPTLTPSASGISGPEVWSNVFAYGLVPLGTLGVDALAAGLDDAFLENWPIDALLIAEATLSATAVNQLVKFTVGRSRPYATGATAADLKDPADANLSFFSGHTTWAFALATSAGTVATLRGYRHAWMVWAAGLPLAATTGILRMGADKHWMSDVLVGAGVGTLFGVGIPVLFHGRQEQPLAFRVSPFPGGAMVSGQF
jgi:membrane-associated phospholipid phosphatase